MRIDTIYLLTAIGLSPGLVINHKMLQFLFISEVTNVQRTATWNFSSSDCARAHKHTHTHTHTNINTRARGCVCVPGILADHKIMIIHARHLLLLPTGTSIKSALNQIIFQHIFYDFL